MQRYLVAITLMICLAGVLALAQEPLRLSVDAKLVPLEALVLDSADHPVLNLQKEDFAVYDNGIPQEISQFFPVTTPYSMLLLLQNSGEDYQRSFLSAAINDFIGSVRAGDKVAVSAFDSVGYWKVLDWRPEPNDKFEHVELKVRNEVEQGLLYRAMQKSLGEFNGLAGRKGVMVLTDGRDLNLYSESRELRVTDPTKDKIFQEVLAGLRDRKIPFYFVAVNTERELPPLGSVWTNSNWKSFLTSVRSRLEQLSEASGGRVFYVNSGNNIDALIRRVILDLGVSYGMAYTPALSGSRDSVHHIEIRVRRDGLRVIQSRDVYTPK